MGNTIWKNLYDAVEVSDSCAVAECVEDIEDYIVERWQEGVREEFERTLRLYIQKSQRMERDLISEKQQIPYQLGLASGLVRAFEQIHRKEGEREGIVEVLAQCSGKTRRILDVLYQDRERGMQHGALAEAIGSTASSLTNLMKKVLQSGAVEASRRGKNTYYMLTAAGERYCAQQQRSQYDALFSGAQRDNLVDTLVEAMRRYYEAGQKQPVKEQTIEVGDHVIPFSESEVGPEYYVKSITGAGSVKYMEMIRDSFKENMVNQEPQNKESFDVYSKPQLRTAMTR